MHASLQSCEVYFSSSPLTSEMGGVEGFGLGMEMKQRLKGEEGAERHIFGHSRETGEGISTNHIQREQKL